MKPADRAWLYLEYLYWSSLQVTATNKRMRELYTKQVDRILFSIAHSSYETP